MKRNWLLRMEQVTIFMGVSIVLLGGFNIAGEVNISAALVTGISLAGLCLTLYDFLNKTLEDIDNPKLDKLVLGLGGLQYCMAAFFVIAFPNFKIITSLPKDTLDSFSTSASVMALGVVFIMIGDNNRRTLFIEQMKQNQQIKDVEKELGEAIDEKLEEIEEFKKIISEQEKTIKDLEHSIKETAKNRKGLITESLSEEKQD